MKRSSGDGNSEQGIHEIELLEIIIVKIQLPVLEIVLSCRLSKNAMCLERARPLCVVKRDAFDLK
jgi:hypothetical protein